VPQRHVRGRTWVDYTTVSGTVQSWLLLHRRIHVADPVRVWIGEYVLCARKRIAAASIARLLWCVHWPGCGCSSLMEPSKHGMFHKFDL
jgi:hypothetical protein